MLREIEEFVKLELGSTDPSHDWLHILRVVRNAEKLLRLEQSAGRLLFADPLVIQVAALMHDVGDHKYSGSYEAGPRTVEKFLSKFVGTGELTAAQAESIVFIVENVSYSKEVANKNRDTSLLPAELKIVQDADRLDAIGAIGISRCMAFSSARNRPFYNDPAHTPQKGTAYGHFFEKLFKLKDMMKTESGRQEAEQRHKYMELFIQQFESEVGLPRESLS